MARRKDGEETKNKLLEAACKVFAEKGYKNTKVADICNLAGANVASVNYYFGDKTTLYAEAWRYAYHKFACLPPAIPPEGTPEEQLRSLITTLMENYLEKGGKGYFTRLYMMELANPTGLIKDAWHELIEPRRQKLLGIIRKIIGPDADPEDVIFCEMSIINQCRVLLTISRSDLEYLLGQPVSPDLVERLADHIFKFSLAGIKAIAHEKRDKLSVQ